MCEIGDNINRPTLYEGILMLDHQARQYKFSEQTNTCEFRKAVNLAYGQGELKLEINIPPQHILAKSKGGRNFE